MKTHHHFNILLRFLKAVDRQFPKHWEGSADKYIIKPHLAAPNFYLVVKTIIAPQWGECGVGVNASNTFQGEQRPLERAQRSGLISGIDLLEEAVGVVAPERARKAVDARCQLET